MNIDVFNKFYINNQIRKLEVVVVSVNDKEVTLMDKNDIIYNFDRVNFGDNLVIEYWCIK